VETMEDGTEKKIKVKYGKFEKNGKEYEMKW